ncbi:amidohydrolase [Roseobacter sp. YSTF-M11]|uniref:Amidohydrolase n=1 Tax=Roseobacter insulae TaxID=2859783 RepID=A0A9X1FU85_9RHOB|nr:amidohydrolase family protein [Roseobacter insulae]MBW4707170.1 amidohydrolase [Roseobacter insulae]
MYNRRTFLRDAAMGAATGLGGCSVFRPLLPTDFDFPVIDIHGHIFNGTDIPVLGYLDQVFLRDPHSDIEPPGLLGALLRLLVFILREATPDAETELSFLRTAPEGDFAPTVTGRSDAGDAAAVARALAKFRADLANRDAAPSLDGSDPDQELLELLGGPDGQQPDLAPSIGAPADFATAQRIYERRAGQNTYLRNSRIFQTVRWAGLLTRPRSRILDEYVTLYKAGGNVAVVSPSVLDFELWFRANDQISPMADQVEVMSEIARRNDDMLVLNFLQFCPIRAALERARGRNPLALLERAVFRRGFAGVKLYPPLGYKPTDNDDTGIFGEKPGKKVRGADINRELDALYTWCSRHDVPIKSHATNSNAAGVCTALNASPALWEPVLTAYPDLRVNLAHFGRFDETGADDTCNGGPTDWEELTAQLVASNDGLYSDLGYWVAAYDGPASETSRIRRRLRTLIRQYPTLPDRLMFGTDWSMLAREPTHPNYIGRIENVTRSVGLDIRSVFHDNAITYLGLRPDTPQWTRLAAFFGEERLQGALT